MSNRKQLRRYKGYGSPGWFAGNGQQRSFSNGKLLLTLVLVTGAIALLIWGLSEAKGAF